MALFLMDPIWWVRRRQAAPIWMQISWKSGMKLRYIRNNMKQLVSKGATNPSWRCPTERATDGHSGHGEWRFCFVIAAWNVCLKVGYPPNQKHSLSVCHDVSLLKWPFSSGTPYSWRHPRKGNSTSTRSLVWHLPWAFGTPWASASSRTPRPICWKVGFERPWTTNFGPVTWRNMFTNGSCLDYPGD